MSLKLRKMTMNKKPWEHYPHIWKTESAYMSFIRGGIRAKLWNLYPIKLEVIKKKRKRIANPNPRGRVKEVWGGECYICKNDFVMNELQVDHITGNHSLKTMSEIETFMTNLLFVDHDDLALVCKDCHKIKSHAERKKITFEEASKEKKVISLMKLNKNKIDNVLKEHNLPCNNDKVRKQGLSLLVDKEVI